LLRFGNGGTGIRYKLLKEFDDKTSNARNNHDLSRPIEKKQGETGRNREKQGETGRKLQSGITMPPDASRHHGIKLEAFASCEVMLEIARCLSTWQFNALHRLHRKGC